MLFDPKITNRLVEVVVEVDATDKIFAEFGDKEFAKEELEDLGFDPEKLQDVIVETMMPDFYQIRPEVLMVLKEQEENN